MLGYEFIERDALYQRAKLIVSQIILPFGWHIIIEDDQFEVFLRVKAEGSDNFTGECMSWKGRHWRLSSHMVDGEIVQTAFLALMTAVEHEMRELFLYKGVALFGPHFDIDKLVELGSKPESVKVRE